MLPSYRAEKLKRITHGRSWSLDGGLTWTSFSKAMPTHEQLLKAAQTDTFDFFPPLNPDEINELIEILTPPQLRRKWGNIIPRS